MTTLEVLETVKLRLEDSKANIQVDETFVHWLIEHIIFYSTVSDVKDSD